MKKIVSYLIPANGHGKILPTKKQLKAHNRNYATGGMVGAAAGGTMLQHLDNSPAMAPASAAQAPAASAAPAASSPAPAMQSQNMTGALASAINNLANSNKGTIDLNLNTKTLPDPKSSTWSGASTYGAGSASITATIFNQDYGLPVSETNNGKGALSVAYNYNDLPNGGSTNGNLISHLTDLYGRGSGIWCYGFNLTYNLNVGGSVSQSQAALYASNPTGQYYNGDTTVKSLFFNVQDAIRNTMYQAGTLTILRGFNISRNFQLNVNLPAGDGATNGSVMTLTMTFFYRPQS